MLKSYPRAVQPTLKQKITAEEQTWLTLCKSPGFAAYLKSDMTTSEPGVALPDALRLHGVYKFGFVP